MSVYQTQGLEQKSQSYDPIPAGTYSFAVTDAVPSAFKSGAGHKVDLTLEIIDGEFKGRKIFDMIALQHTNMEWARGTQARLDAICKVAGLTNLESWSQLINTTFSGKIYIEKSKDPQYEDKSKLDKVMGPAAMMQQSAPQMQQPVQQMQQPTMQQPMNPNQPPAPPQGQPMGVVQPPQFNDDVPF